MSKMNFLDNMFKDFQQVTHNKPTFNESSIDSLGNQIILTNNKNRLKLKEYTKKLQHYRQELLNLSNQVDLEYTRFKESKISIATILTREINKMQKNDEDQIKETLNILKKLIDFDQKMTIEIENVFENQQTITQDEIEAASQVFYEIEQQVLAAKSKKIELGSMDFKLLSMNEYNKLIIQIQEQQLNNNDKVNELFKNEQKINTMLSQQIEEKNLIIQQLQNGSVEWIKSKEYDQYILQQIDRFRLPLPQSNNNLLKYVFDGLDQTVYDQECHIKELQTTLITYQQENEELKSINQTIIKENQYFSNQIKQQVEDKQQVKIKLQDELTNVLSNSIEVEKENHVVNSQLQIYVHQIKQLQKTNTGLYKEIQKYRDEINDLNEIKLKLEDECNAHLKVIDKLNYQNNELENILYESTKQQQENDQAQKFKSIAKNQTSQIHELEQQLINFENVNSKLENQLSNTQQLKKNLETELSNTNQASQIIQKQQEYQLNDLKQQVQELENQVNFLENELDQIKKINQKLQQQLEQSQIKSDHEIEESFQIKYNDLQKEFNQYKQLADNRIKKAVIQQQEIHQQLQDHEQNRLLESHKMLEKETNLKTENSSLQQKINILQEQIKSLEITHLNELKVTKNALEQQQQQYEQQIQLFDKLKIQASQLEQAVLDKEQTIQQLKQELEGNSEQFEQQAHEIQEEYDKILEKNEKTIKQQQITISNQKHELNVLQRQIDTLEFSRQQDLLSFKIQNDKRQIQFAKELEQVKEVLNTNSTGDKPFMKKILQLDEYQPTPDRLTQQKYEQIITDLEQKYEKQIGNLQEQLSYIKQGESFTKTNTHKPPKALQKSPNCYTNSPASSSIQRSFYREVAKFSKELDDSNEEQRQRQTGIIKKNKHIFIDDEYNTSQEQASSIQNFSSTGRAFQVDHAVQTEKQCEDIFAPFDHRVCLRCKKNDMIAPNFCKFKEINQFSDLSASQGSVNRMKSSRVLKEHIYGSNLSWRQRPSNSVSKANLFSLSEKVSEGMNTILTLVNVDTMQKRGSSQKRNKRNSESLSISFSSKIDSNRSNK